MYEITETEMDAIHELWFMSGYKAGLKDGQEMYVEDTRKTYLTEEERVAQAKRILPVVEAEIDGGETRQIFFDIRDMCVRDLAEACYLGCYYEGRHPRCRIHNDV